MERETSPFLYSRVTRKKTSQATSGQRLLQTKLDSLRDKNDDYGYEASPARKSGESSTQY